MAGSSTAMLSTVMHAHGTIEINLSRRYPALLQISLFLILRYIEMRAWNAQT